jgi:hypothetical protein
MRFLTSDFFPPRINRIPRPKMCRKLRNWSSQVADLKLRTSEKIAIAELRSCGCGATFLQKLRNCDCGSASFKLRNCDCGVKKMLRVPTSGFGYTETKLVSQDTQLWSCLTENSFLRDNHFYRSSLVCSVWKIFYPAHLFLITPRIFLLCRLNKPREGVTTRALILGPVCMVATTIGGQVSS